MLTKEEKISLKLGGKPPKPQQPQHVLGQILIYQPYRELYTGAGSTRKKSLNIKVLNNLPEG